MSMKYIVNSEKFHTSLESAAGAFLGGSLTLPEGPLGRKKMPSSAPLVIARLSWEIRVPVKSMLYLSTAYYDNQSAMSN